jgi:carboxymethylenebutenolidase
MIQSRSEQIQTPDGDHFDGHVVVPDRGPRPGVLLLQEIFGVNESLKSKAVDLASAGYVVLCPDMFWRVERRVSLHHDEGSMRTALQYAERFAAVDPTLTISDLKSALAALRALPECDGRAAVVGYCLGGSLAYELAVAGDPDACVSYYGSRIATRLGDAGAISCPVIFHFGAKDPYIPVNEVDQIRATFESRADAEVYVQAGAGHAFENSLALQFHHKEAAKRSWALTVDFLARSLPS